MNGKRKIWMAAAAALILIAVGAWLLLRGAGDQAIDETLNLLHNSSFEETDGSGGPDGWIEGKWYWDSGVSVLELSDEAYSGEHSVMVYSAGENDARFTQTIAVEPNSYYRIRAMVKAEGCGEGRNGAGVSIEDTFVSSDYVYDTNGEWVELTLYGKTGPKQDYMTIMARVGGYGSLNTGKAWFDDVEMVRLRALPDDVRAVSFATNPPSSAKNEEPEAGSGSGRSAGIAALSMALIVLAGAAMGQKRSKWDAMILLVAAGAAALIVRIVCAVSIRGYEVDMNCFTGWAARMVQYGPTGFYDAGWCDYPPGYMLVLYLLGGLRGLFRLTQDGPAVWLLFKSVPILCDMLTGLFIYRVAEKKLNPWQAAVLAAAYLLTPAIILNSAAWGQVDSVLTLLLMISVYACVRGRWVNALSVYAVAVLMKPQALMFGPIGLMAAVCEVWRSENRRASLIEIGKGIGAAAAIMLAVITPFSLGQGQDPVTWAVGMYAGTLSSYPYITVNACNLYSLLGMNWRSLSDSGWYQYLAWGMYGLAFGYSFFLYIKAGKRKNLFLVCAVMLTVVFAFGAKMHERYLFPAMGLLTLAFMLDQDVRLLIALALISAGQFVNVSQVLLNEHLNSALPLINGAAAVMNILGAFAAAWAAWDICVRDTTVALPESAASRVAAAERGTVNRPIVREDSGLHLRRIDYVLMAAVTLIYSVVAFANLGSMKAPETAWTSTLAGETVVFDLGEEREFNLAYYGGICNSSFTVSLSDDGEAWSEEQLAVYDQGEIFRWLWFVPSERKDTGDFTSLESGYPTQTARYVSIRAEKAGLVLHEFAFLDENGETLPVASAVSYGGDGDRANNPQLLIDEQDTVPAYPSYLNSTYFDEIYHARTAYEHLHGMRPYETTHPPLGKVLIMLGVQLFGMTPFGWRFTGTLLGCLMLPIMYLLAKQLLKKTEYAFLAMFLLAVDCMHFTQTRISTIDTYGVFFILLMYLFMFRYCQMNFFVDDFKKTLIPLGLCGVSMGLGIASKWICIYAGVGLAVLFFYTLGRRYVEYCGARRSGGGSEAEKRARENFWKYFWITGAFCVVFFIVIPLLIYYFSYYWYMKPMGGLSVERVWNAQLSMFRYHSGLTNDDHFFASPWYEWPLIVKPMWYYSGTEFMKEGVVSSISCMGNPAVWWSGAAAMIFVIMRLVGFFAAHPNRIAQMEEELEGEALTKEDRARIEQRLAKERSMGALNSGAKQNYLYVVIAFAAQYVPWMLVPRSMFIYHYFASVPFIIIAIAMVSQWMKKRGFRFRIPLFVCLLAAATVLFIAFYPLMSGTPVARSFAMYLRWFNWYNF